MVIQAVPIKIGDQHWVNVVAIGTELKPRGPFLDADEAEAMAQRLRWYGRALSEAAHG